MPRRRCVGKTPTAVTPAAGTLSGPGIVRLKEYADVAPTMRPRSTAARLRSTSRRRQSFSISSAEGVHPKAASAVRIQPGNSSAVTVRISKVIKGFHPWVRGDADVAPGQLPASTVRGLEAGRAPGLDGRRKHGIGALHGTGRSFRHVSGARQPAE